MFEEDLTAEGICGAENLANEYVDPTGLVKDLFKYQKYAAVCTHSI